MDAERYRRLQEIFDGARALPAAERAAYLEAACAGDAALRGEVEGLLSHHDAPDPFLEDSAVPAGAELLAQALHEEETAGGARGDGARMPRRIGRYEILGVLGEGGMGIVYDAQQDVPRRRVALKVILGGAGSRRLAARFRREAEVLGQLEHPGIARIYEAGADESGADSVPYLAMERISGRPLLEHARARGLSTPHRLELFVKVCDAVDHAHRRGVIHRDLKPGNILVDETTDPPQPKVLDFGIARLIDTGERALTLETGPGQLLGTLAYMSPEQAVGDPGRVDQRSDIYALGVILFELLSGNLPIDLRGRAIPEAVRAIQNDEPTRLASRSGRVHRDLETIALKALEKDPARRYVTAAGLADDVRRFLRDEPIRARPATALYQLRKFARRHRAIVGGLAAAFVAMAAGTIIAISQARVAMESRDFAEERAEAARYQAFRARLVAARAALESRDAVDFMDQMERIDVDLRGWEWRYLRSRYDLSSARIDPGEPIAAAIFRGGGAIVAVAARSGEIRMYDASTGDLAERVALGRTLAGPADFTADGEILAAAAGDDARTLVLWRVATGERIAETSGLDAACASVAVRDDGRWVVATARDRRGWIWDGSERPPARIERQSLPSARAPRSALFVPEEDRVVLASGRGSFGTFDLRTGERVEQSNIDTTEIHSLAVNHGRTMYALGEEARKIYVVDRKTRVPLMTLRGHRGAIRGLAFSPDDRRLASGGARSVRLWELFGNRTATVYTGHEADIVFVAYASDGHRVLSVAADHTVRVWDPRPSEAASLLYTQRSHPRGAAWFSGGELIVSASWHGYLEVWDGATGDRVAVARLRSAIDEGDRIYTMALARRHGRRVALGCRDGVVRIFDLGRGEVAAAAIVAKTGVEVLAISPDGERVAAADGASVALRSAPDLEALAAWPPPAAAPDAAAVGALEFSPSGDTLAVGQGRDVVLLDLLDGADLAPRARLTGAAGAIASVAFRDDGRKLAAGDAAGGIAIWDVASGKLDKAFADGDKAVLCVGFSRDGARVASGDPEGGLRLWDPIAGEDLLEIGGHYDRIFAVEFAAGDARIASASRDGSVRVWDLAPDRERLRARHDRRGRASALEPAVLELLGSAGAEPGGVPAAVDAFAAADALSAARGLDAAGRRIALGVALGEIWQRAAAANGAAAAGE